MADLLNPAGGYTTGTCAAAAAAAAAQVLCGRPAPAVVDVALPDGGTARLDIAAAGGGPDGAFAAVVKRAGDDPDVTDGAEVRVTLRPLPAGDVLFVAGEGVGRVTKPGLAVPPGEPAINPVPRRMIREAVRAVTPRPVEIAVGIAGGAALAARTFNPRLGVEGGLSILGTSGRVRPFSLQAVRETVRCGLSVAAAAGVTAVVLVPGNLGRRAAHRLYSLAPEQAVEVANEWGYAADRLADFPFRAVLALGHPGKLAKLASGDWDTHSARSAPALDVLRAYAPAAHRASAAAAATVEALLTSLPAAAARTAADRAAAAVRDALAKRTGCRLEVAVLFTDLAGREVGRAGRFRAWTPAGGTR